MVCVDVSPILLLGDMESGGNQLFVRFSGGGTLFNWIFPSLETHFLPSRPPVPAFEGVNSERDDDLMKWRVDD